MSRKSPSPQEARLRHKEAAKGREVVDCVARFIVPSPRHVDHHRVVEAALQCTRDELAALQESHARGDLIINYIREDR